MPTAAPPWLLLEPPRAEALASTYGTPAYVCDAAILRARARLARAAVPARLLFAVKANPHPAVLRALRGHVDGLDIASGGELSGALAAGFPGVALSFAGPGKREAELTAALDAGAVISLESPQELTRVSALARAKGLRAQVRVRVNLREPARAFRVEMAGGPSPFGVDEEALVPLLDALRADDALDFTGLHVHPGAQCTSISGFVRAAAAALDVVARVERETGLAVPSLNLGGGLGVLAPGQELDVVAVGERLAVMREKYRATMGRAPELLLEPGRWLAGPAGVYVTRVLSEKVSRGVHFVVLDGGLHQHLTATGRLAPRDAPRLPIVNLSRPDATPVTRTLVGPLCTPLDSFGEVTLPEPRVGDLLGVLGSGAYGPTFSPLRFLGHPPPAEVLLGDG